MPIRNRHRVGSYLMTDDDSDQEHYIEDMRQLWDGTWRHKKDFETRQPQEFVYARNDPKALRHIRPQAKAAAPLNAISEFVGVVSAVAGPSLTPAGHLFRGGIGSMIIVELGDEVTASIFSDFEVR